MIACYLFLRSFDGSRIKYGQFFCNNIVFKQPQWTIGNPKSTVDIFYGQRMAKAPHLCSNVTEKHKPPLVVALLILILLYQVNTLRHCRVLSPLILSMGPVSDNSEQRPKPEVEVVLIIHI